MSPYFCLCVLYVCVCPLFTHSPWNRVLTPFSFAHMSSWIPSSVSPLGRTRSQGSSTWVCAPSRAQHHGASTVPWHCLYVLSCSIMAALVSSYPYVFLCVSSLILCKHHHPCDTGTKQCVLFPAHQDMFSRLAFCSPPASRRPGWWCC